MPCKVKPPTRKRNDNGNKKTKPKDTRASKQNNKSQASKENRITNYFPTVSRRLLAAQNKIEEYNRKIKHCIEKQVDPKEYLIIAEFEDKGKGIVAGSTIPKGGFICEYSGDLIKVEEAKIREKEYELSGAGCYMYYFNWNSIVWCIDATKPTGRYGRLINHSRKAPNCKTKVFELNGIPHLIFIALREIKSDEEILYDYGERDPLAIKSNPWLKST